MAKSTERSIEEKVEDFFKRQLDNYHVEFKGKNEILNLEIDKALKNYFSKSGGQGKNFPDIQLLIEPIKSRYIPVMIEVKGSKGKLEKRNKKTGEIEQVTFYDKDGPVKKGTEEPTHKAGDPNYSAITGYAVNGAVHYANAILNKTSYSEVIAIGLNGTRATDGSIVTEIGAYYLSKRNKMVPKKIKSYSDLSFLKKENLDDLIKDIDRLVLTNAELEQLTQKMETTLESKIKSIHQSLYNNEQLKTKLSTNEKLYLFCGLIIAGLGTEEIAPLKEESLEGNESKDLNDGTVIKERIKAFLSKKCGKENEDGLGTIIGLLNPVFEKKDLWEPVNGESILKTLYRQVSNDIIPCLKSDLHLDFTGKILNSLGDWVHIENDKTNDVVLTPRYVTKLMAMLACVNKNSYVWDTAMGSAGFLVSAMDLMIKDAENSISNKKELKEKIESIKSRQILGIEILGNIYILAFLNMVLMGDGSSNIINGDSHKYQLSKYFPADVFLLNPPYSAEGKGLVFVEEALSQMNKGYACVLIQESAGSGGATTYAKKILENNTLLASIHMSNIFCGKASVQTAIYLFKVGNPHDIKVDVKFIDFSNDGYTRQNRKKSTQEVNLRNVDHAEERYKEVVDLVKYGKKSLHYLTENEYIEAPISLNGNDWTFAQHRKIDTTPKIEDFRKTVSDYLDYNVSNLLKSQSKENDCLGK